MKTIKFKNTFVAVHAIESNELEIISQNDLPGLKKVIITINIQTDGDPILREVVLWEGEQYDKIGQWTDNDVNNELEKILFPSNSENTNEDSDK